MTVPNFSIVGCQLAWYQAAGALRDMVRLRANFIRHAIDKWVHSYPRAIGAKWTRRPTNSADISSGSRTIFHLILELGSIVKSVWFSKQLQAIAQSKEESAMQDPEPKPPRPDPDPQEPHLPGPDPDPPGPDIIDPPVQTPMWA